jgi:hypothetical protein
MQTRAHWQVEAEQQMKVMLAGQAGPEVQHQMDIMPAAEGAHLLLAATPYPHRPVLEALGLHLLLPGLQRLAGAAVRVARMRSDQALEILADPAAAAHLRLMPQAQRAQ